MAAFAENGEFMSKSRYVITVTRQFGSMGRLLAKKLANKINQ